MGIPLHCELCHIRNIEGQNLMARDEGILILMRRANMDTFWGTYKSTVEGNLVSLKRIGRYVLEGNVFNTPLLNWDRFLFKIQWE